jgi:hypothetical protein
MSKQEFDGYIGVLEEVIKASRRRAPALIVADDFNVKLRPGVAKGQSRGEHTCWT